MNYQQTIALYQPQTPEEEQVKKRALAEIADVGDVILTRAQTACHLTVSGFILNPAMDRTLMVHHHIYQSYCWTGGHADGEKDLLQVALREAREETGIQRVYPLTQGAISLDLLSVPEHQKRGATVAAHEHITVTYGLIAPEDQEIQANLAENSSVAWLPLEHLAEHCQELHMLPIYAKLQQRMQKIAAAKREIMPELPEVLLPWYWQYARALPWRQNPTPYQVWVSEIMLQQTRVEAVKSYYQRFLQQLPDIQALANAPEEQLLKLWEGLGYYNRVRNMQKAAREIMTTYHGEFPQTLAEIKALPGIGEYTAGAIASIALEQPVPAVDGNVLRVISRLTDSWDDISKTKTKQRITADLAAIYPQTHCGDFTQSLMELGAIICLPNGEPLCGACPLQAECRSRQNGTYGELPIRPQKKQRKIQQKTVFLLTCQGKIALRKREEKGLLAGLWEFPNVSGFLTKDEMVDQLAEWQLGLVKMGKKKKAKHIFTHIEWQMIGYRLECETENQLFTWLSWQDLQGQMALPTAFKPFFTLL